MLEYYGCVAQIDGSCLLHFCYTENRKPYILCTTISEYDIIRYEDAVDYALLDISTQIFELRMCHR